MIRSTVSQPVSPLADRTSAAGSARGGRRSVRRSHGVGGPSRALWLALLLAAVAFPPSLRAIETYSKVVSGSVNSAFDSAVSLQQAESDLDGTTFVASVVRGEAQFAAGVVVPAKFPATPSSEPLDLILGRVGSGGGWVWAKRGLVPIPITSSSALNALTTPNLSSNIERDFIIKDLKVSETNVYVAGFFRSTRQVGFAVKFDKAGTIVWTRFVYSDGDTLINAVEEDQNGNVYLGGRFTGRARLVGMSGTQLLDIAIGSGLTVTTDQSAFITKLTPAGAHAWTQNTTSGNTDIEETVALEVDGDNAVHVLMNLFGTTINVRNANGSNYLPAPVRLNYASGIFAGKINDGGFWSAGRAIGSATELAVIPTGNNTRVAGTDLKLVAGKVFLAGSFVSTGYRNQGFLLRLLAQNYAADTVAAYLLDGATRSLGSFPLRLRGSGQNLFVTGEMPLTLQVYGQIDPKSNSLGTVYTELLSLRVADFVGAFDTNLRPLWLRTTSRAESSPPPRNIRGGLLAFDSASRRVYWGGDFRTEGTEQLLVGDAPYETALTTPITTPPARRVERWGWLTAFDVEGRPIRQVRLTVESAYPPILINGLALNTTLYADTFLEGTTVQIAAQEFQSAGTRRVVTGYTLDTQPGVTPANNLTTTLLTDAKVVFNWLTQYKLTITSDHATAGLINAASAGDPEPLFGETWINEGEYVDATIGGFVEPVDATELGSRYVVRSYTIIAPFRNPTTETVNLTQVVDRVRVLELKAQPLTGPVNILYSWKKQFSVTANHTADAQRALLVGRQVTAQGAEVAGTRVVTSGGQLWFDANATIEVGALNQDLGASLALKGWRYASPVVSGFFDATTFEVSDPAVSDSAELATKLQSKSIGNDANNAYWVKLIPSLNRPITLLWNYGDSIYTIHTGVGEQVNLAGATPAIPANLVPPGAWIGGRVVDGPPGSTLDQMLIWDAVAEKAIPLRPGIVLVDWESPSGAKVVTQIFTGFRDEPWQDLPANKYGGPAPYLHIASTPPVDLDPDPADNRFFANLGFTTGDGVAAGKQFTASRAGKSVLLFYTAAAGAAVGDPAKENVAVRVVNTELWNAGPLGKRTATIGTALTSPTTTDVPGYGYVIQAGANYNPRIYNRVTAQGPIIPVNKLDSPPATLGPRDLVVVWYQRVDGILWPYNPALYGTFNWPTGNRIVIASRLGSEGFNSANTPQLSFDPELYDQVEIYHQPDRSQPGFNPNEEHARIFPSLYQSLKGREVPAAFALRDDLNLTLALITAKGAPLTAADYTSDPYVLVQYFDKQAGQFAMAVYKVEREAPTVNDPRVLELPGAVNANYTFNYRMLAGELVNAPYPLNLVIGLDPCVHTGSGPSFSNPIALPNGSYFEDVNAAQRTWFVDHRGGAWAVSGGSALRARYYYPVLPDFWYPFGQDTDPTTTAPGDCVPLLPNFNLSAALSNKDLGVYDTDAPVRTAPVAIQFSTAWPDDPPILKVGETLTYAGGENKADNPDAPGLPGVIGFAAGELVFDSKNPAMTPAGHLINFMARLISPLEDRRIAFTTATLPQNLNNPASPDVTVEGDTWYFNKLPPSLQKRIFFKPLAKLNAADSPGVLGLRGFVNDRTLGAGDLTAAPPPVYVLEPNVLTPAERDTLRALGGGNATWNTKVDSLYNLARNPNGVTGTGWNVGLEPSATGPTSPKPLTALGPGLALITNPELLDPANTLTTGYVTLAENNDESLGDAPVTLHVIKVDATRRYRGAIKTLLPPNVFDEKITLRHTADFGGNVDALSFAWWFHEEDGTVKVGDVPPGPNGSSSPWSPFANANGVVGQNQIDLHGNPTLLLADNLFFVRYRHTRAAVAESSWSGWAGAANSSIRDLNSDGKPDYRAQLATGWVKRVLDGINPFEARIREFSRNNSPSTAASLIQQLGAPFVGPVALNASKDVVENLGLIELYETVLKRARELSIDASQPTATSGINAALLLAATRLADFYTLLGHEAWDDALDPTIGFGNDAVDPGSLNAARFCFENQLPSLLDEELALLRGTDDALGRPLYNRLFWNFTKGEGEVAYALNYQITDVNQDGFLDENDALKLHPMGHGDAWGHYLNAVRKHYDLLRSPTFNWEARAEYYNLLDVVLGVDFLDERNFARTAAARARVGSEIVNLTFRSRYSVNAEKLLGYPDPDTSRGWGVTEWARRAGQAAYFDWVVTHSLLPLADPDPTRTGLQRVDRHNVTELAEIATHLAGIQETLDGANSGLNAIGLDPNVLPFDIDPTFLDVGSTAQVGTRPVQGLSHFEQIFERALAALRNADTAFQFANERKAQLRQVAQSAEQLRQQAVAQDLEFRNRLIEIFGTPYAGQIGAGKAYPAGYAGPDLNLFMYVDVNAITPETVPVANTDTYFDEYVSFYDLTQDIPEEFRTDLEDHFLDDISLEGNTAVELLGDDLVHLRLPATAGDYTFVAPADWGQRDAPGRLQTFVGEMLQVQAELAIAVGDYDFLVKQLRDRVALLQLRADINTEILGIKDTRYGTIIGLNTAINALQTTAALTEFTANAAKDIADATADGLPKVIGVANDTFFAGRAILTGFGATAQFLLRAGTVAATQTADILESSKEIIDLRDEIDIDRKEMSYELRGMLYEIEELLVNEGVTRIRLFALREQLRGLIDQYRATLQEGLRLLEERRNANAQLAADTQSNRYHDLLFRGGRHASIQRYRALFDLAQRYCYLAAKAYDYETNFEPTDRASAQPLLTRIARARTLGQLNDGFPVAGDGLAGIMASLEDNFRAVEGRLGFNNFQIDTTSFSLRQEQARIATDTDWRDQLELARVADLWSLSEFRRFCRPFAPRGVPQPGLVLRFGTQVIAGENFFGQPLGAGDSAYDPTLFATKIRAAGIRFQGYPVDTLARTPYVYLIPAGRDYLTVPNSLTLKTRSWTVMDQAIPAPHLTGPADLSQPGWLASLDTLSGRLGEIRRFSSFRAAVAAEDPDLNVTRFIGRSVWNDQWILIVPGQSLHSDPQLALDEFVENVTDIQLSLETYGYSGN